MIRRAALPLLLAACGAEQPAPAKAEVYHSISGGYHFAIPATWAGRYRVDTVQGPVDSAAPSGLKQMITFAYLPQDGSIRPQVLLALVTMPGEEWDRLSREEGPPQGDLLGRRGDQVVVAALPQSNPFDSLSPDGRQFHAIRLTLDQVRRAITID